MKKIYFLVKHSHHINIECQTGLHFIILRIQSLLFKMLSEVGPLYMVLLFFSVLVDMCACGTCPQVTTILSMRRILRGQYR